MSIIPTYPQRRSRMYAARRGCATPFSASPPRRQTPCMRTTMPWNRNMFHVEHPLAGSAAPARRETGERRSQRPGHLPQLELLDLARARLGQFGEDDVAGDLVGGEVLAAPGDELLGRDHLARLELDEGARGLAPSVVGLRDHRRRLHGR